MMAGAANESSGEGRCWAAPGVRAGLPGPPRGGHFGLSGPSTGSPLGAPEPPVRDGGGAGGAVPAVRRRTGGLASHHGRGSGPPGLADPAPPTKSNGGGLAAVPGGGECASPGSGRLSGPAARAPARRSAGRSGVTPGVTGCEGAPAWGRGAGTAPGGRAGSCGQPGPGLCPPAAGRCGAVVREECYFHPQGPGAAGGWEQRRDIVSDAVLRVPPNCPEEGPRREGGGAGRGGRRRPGSEDGLAAPPAGPRGPAWTWEPGGQGSIPGPALPRGAGWIPGRGAGSAGGGRSMILCHH